MNTHDKEIIEDRYDEIEHEYGLEDATLFPVMGLQ
jgi:hypothetical protein